MLPAPFRLSDKKEFARAFREGQYAALDELAIKWLPAHLSPSKVGFVAGKKLFAKATDRNRAKRLMREALRPYLFQLRPGFAIIVLYRYRPDRLSFRKNSDILGTLLQKNNLLQKIS